MQSDKVYQKIYENGIKLFSYNIPNYKATVIEIDKNYGIFMDYNKIEDSDDEFCVAAHEYGHCITGTTHSLNSDYDTISRHEYRADRQSVLEFLPVDKIKEAISKGCLKLYEIAEYVDLPEKFVYMAIQHYQCMELI